MKSFCLFCTAIAICLSTVSCAQSNMIFPVEDECKEANKELEVLKYKERLRKEEVLRNIDMVNDWNESLPKGE